MVLGPLTTPVSPTTFLIPPLLPDGSAPDTIDVEVFSELSIDEFGIVDYGDPEEITINIPENTASLGTDPALVADGYQDFTNYGDRIMTIECRKNYSSTLNPGVTSSA